ncbi:MAG: hypothetical protein U0441_23410 [Polyangiaceae bacterium]
MKRIFDMTVFAVRRPAARLAHLERDIPDGGVKDDLRMTREMMIDGVDRLEQSLREHFGISEKEWDQILDEYANV